MAGKRLIISVVCLVFVAGAALFYDREHRRQSFAAQMEDQLRRDIHSGMSRAEIEAYLNKNGIQHSYVEKFDKGKSVERTEFARIPDQSTRVVLVRTDIQVRFTFDEAGRLSSYSFKETLIGP
jgi:hypothetical protein